MITQATRTESGISASVSTKNRVILAADGSIRRVIQARPFSRTYSAGTILEISDDIIGDDAPERIPETIKGMVFAGDLSEAELIAILDLYPAWTAGAAYAQGALIRHESALYKVNQAHTSAAHWVPGAEGMTALYSSVMPEGVIGEWVQPSGAHNAFPKGARVTHVGKTWESTIDANTTEPGTLLPWGYWIEV